MEKGNIYLYAYEYKKTSRAKRDVARMAFNGWVDKPYDDELSSELAEPKNNKNLRKETKPGDYNLSTNDTWKVFKELPEFEQLEGQIRESLAKYGVNPTDVSKLSSKDFCFLINDALGDEKNNSVRVFKESYKAKNTKKFIKENEEEFKTGMYDMLGVDMNLLKKIALSSKEIMEKNKNLPSNKIEEMVAMEKNRLVRDAGVNKEKFKAMLKSYDYVKTLVGIMKEGRTDLSKEKDVNGNPKWEGMPVIDVHHIVNIKDAAILEDKGQKFTDVNNYENMCFIVRDPQHDAMHALENDLNGYYREDIYCNPDTNKKYVYRAQPPEGVKCVFGFNSVMYDKEYLDNYGLSKDAVKAKATDDPNYYKNKWTNDDAEAKRDAERKENKHLSNPTRAFQNE